MAQLYLSKCFDEEAQLLVRKALDQAKEAGQSQVTSLHILDQVLQEEESSPEMQNLQKDLQNELATIESGSAKPDFAKELYETLIYAQNVALQKQKEEHTVGIKVTRNDLINSLSTFENRANQLIKKHKVRLRKFGDVKKIDKSSDDVQSTVSETTNNISLTNLLKFGKDITDSAEKNEFGVIAGREKELAQIIEILARRQKNSPLLVGEP